MCVCVEGVGGGGLKLAANRTSLAQGLCLEGVEKQDREAFNAVWGGPFFTSLIL